MIVEGVSKESLGIKKIQLMLPTISSQLSHVYFCVEEHFVSSTDLEVLYIQLFRIERVFFVCFFYFSNTCRIVFSSYSLYIPWSVLFLHLLWFNIQRI